MTIQTLVNFIFLVLWLSSMTYSNPLNPSVDASRKSAGNRPKFAGAARPFSFSKTSVRVPNSARNSEKPSHQPTLKPVPYSVSGGTLLKQTRHRSSMQRRLGNGVRFRQPPMQKRGQNRFNQFPPSPPPNRQRMRPNMRQSPKTLRPPKARRGPPTPQINRSIMGRGGLTNTNGRSVPPPNRLSSSPIRNTLASKRSQQKPNAQPLVSHKGRQTPIDTNNPKSNMLPPSSAIKLSNPNTSRIPPRPRSSLPSTIKQSPRNMAPTRSGTGPLKDFSSRSQISARNMGPSSSVMQRTPENTKPQMNIHQPLHKMRPSSPLMPSSRPQSKSRAQSIKAPLDGFASQGSNLQFSQQHRQNLRLREMNMGTSKVSMATMPLDMSSSSGQESPPPNDISTSIVSPGNKPQTSNMDVTFQLTQQKSAILPLPNKNLSRNPPSMLNIPTAPQGTTGSLQSSSKNNRNAFPSNIVISPGSASLSHGQPNALAMKSVQKEIKNTNQQFIKNRSPPSEMTASGNAGREASKHWVGRGESKNSMDSQQGAHRIVGNNILMNTRIAATRSFQKQRIIRTGKDKNHSKAALVSVPSSPVVVEDSSRTIELKSTKGGTNSNIQILTTSKNRGQQKASPSIGMTSLKDSRSFQGTGSSGTSSGIQIPSAIQSGLRQQKEHALQTVIPLGTGSSTDLAKISSSHPNKEGSSVTGNTQHGPKTKGINGGQDRLSTGKVPSGIIAGSHTPVDMGQTNVGTDLKSAIRPRYQESSAPGHNGNIESKIDIRSRPNGLQAVSREFGKDSTKKQRWLGQQSDGRASQLSYTRGHESSGNTGQSITMKSRQHQKGMNPGSKLLRQGTQQQGHENIITGRFSSKERNLISHLPKESSLKGKLQTSVQKQNPKIGQSSKLPTKERASLSVNRGSGISSNRISSIDRFKINASSTIEVKGTGTNGNSQQATLTGNQNSALRKEFHNKISNDVTNVNTKSGRGNVKASGKIKKTASNKNTSGKIDSSAGYNKNTMNAIGTLLNAKSGNVNQQTKPAAGIASKGSGDQIPVEETSGSGTTKNDKSGLIHSLSKPLSKSYQQDVDVASVKSTDPPALDKSSKVMFTGASGDSSTSATEGHVVEQSNSHFSGTVPSPQENTSNKPTPKNLQQNGQNQEIGLSTKAEQPVLPENEAVTRNPGGYFYVDPFGFFQFHDPSAVKKSKIGKEKIYDKYFDFFKTPEGTTEATYTDSTPDIFTTPSPWLLHYFELFQQSKEQKKYKEEEDNH